MKTFKQFIAETSSVIKLRGNSSTNTKAFMDHFHATTKEHPLNRNARIHGKTTIHVSERDGHIHLHDIMTHGTAEKGEGTKALKHLTTLANRHNVVIKGHAKAYSKEGHHIQRSEHLKSWYEKHGFKAHQKAEDGGYPIHYQPKRLH